MSKDAAMAFLKKVSQDKEMQARLAAFAAEQGYDFSPEELSEIELDAAAGGLSAYLKIPDIDGESQRAASHGKWIHLQSVSVPVHKPGGGG